MPFTTGIIDDYRDGWPEVGIEKTVRAGIDGQAVFYASENGHQIGTPLPRCDETAVSLSDIDLRPFNAVAAPQRKPKG